MGSRGREWLKVLHSPLDLTATVLSISKARVLPGTVKVSVLGHTTYPGMSNTPQSK